MEAKGRAFPSLERSSVASGNSVPTKIAVVEPPKKGERAGIHSSTAVGICIECLVTSVKPRFAIAIPHLRDWRVDARECRTCLSDGPVVCLKVNAGVEGISIECDLAWFQVTDLPGVFLRLTIFYSGFSGPFCWGVEEQSTDVGSVSLSFLSFFFFFRANLIRLKYWISASVNSSGLFNARFISFFVFIVSI